MADIERQPEASLVQIIPHPTARNVAVAKSPIQSGSVVASIPSLMTSLLPSEKGRRCDECHAMQFDKVTLRRCSGCAAFWYCGTTCQNKAWKAHHRKICKNYNPLIVSAQYQALTVHDRVDTVLLSQLVADPDLWRNRRGDDALGDPVLTFLDLLKVPRSDGSVPPLCLPQSARSAENLDHAQDLYSRFGNNNFVLHSHLDSYAHGVFPLASRLFNHSCVPNAVCKYVITPSEPVRMEVVALHDIKEGTEITIPYLDPALPYHTRQDALRANYGFTCDCAFCAFQCRVPSPAPPAPRGGSAELKNLDAALRTFALGDVVAAQQVRIPTSPGLFERLPAELLPVLHESYLPALSELFSRTSHEGPHAEAVEAGLTLLALYVVVYPPNYPQIGMHALELAKTLWNLACTDPGGLAGATEVQVRQHAGAALDFAASVLRNFGPEGDEGGPLEEIRVLAEMLNG